MKIVDGYGATARLVLNKAELMGKKRKDLEDEDFALPGERAYPVHAEAHARNALARVAQHGTPAEQRRVRRAVKKRYPGIEVEGLSKGMPMDLGDGWLAIPDDVHGGAFKVTGDSQVIRAWPDLGSALAAAARYQELVRASRAEQERRDARLGTTSGNEPQCTLNGTWRYEELGRAAAHCAELCAWHMATTTLAKAVKAPSRLQAWSIDGYNAVLNRWASGLHIVTIDGPDMALPFHLVVPKATTALAKARAAVELLKAGKTPIEGVYRRVELPSAA